MSGTLHTPQKAPPIEFRRAGLSEIILLRDEMFCRPLGFPPKFELDYNDATLHFVAERDGRIVAAVTVWPTLWQDHVPAWQLMALFVVPGMRRKGIALQLLDYVLTMLGADYGRHWIWAEVPVSQIELFQAVGFERLGDERYHPNMDRCLQMVLAI